MYKYQYVLHEILFCPLQKEGMVKNLGLGKLTDFEINLEKAAMPELVANIKKGEDFVANNPPQ